jgi:hypothetical protein
MAVTFINPFIHATGVTTYKVTLTIASGEVSSNLTDYPVYVRLSGMPAGFWTHVKEDGGDIRVKTTGGTTVPTDLVWFDYEGEDGVLFFLASSVLSGSDNDWDIHYGDAALDLLDPGDANGRDDVWANYEAVFLFGQTCGDDRTGGAMARIRGDANMFQIAATSSTDLDSHQGVCWDGTHYYTTDDNAIYKWNSSWTLVDSNTDPIGDAAIGGSPTVNHLGDPDVRDGRLYIPLECYPASGGLYNAHIVVFDPSDLSFIEDFDISAQAHEASSVAYCDRDDLLYVTDYDGNNSTIYKYDPLDGSYEGTLATSTPIPNRQGITWWRNAFWISNDANDETHRVLYDGTATTGDQAGGGGGVFGDTTAGNYEGIGHRSDALLQHIDPGATERVDVWTPRDDALSAGGGYRVTTGTPNAIANARPSYNVYTLACTLAIASKTQNRTAVSYWDESAGTTNTRQVIAYRHATPSLAIWDTNNSWLEPSPAINPTLDQAYRVHAVYNNTTSRKIYVDGTLVNTHNTIAAVPAGLDTILVLVEDDSVAEAWNGNVGFVYLYPGVLSDAWIAAEYSNLNAPGSFSALGSEQPA